MPADRAAVLAALRDESNPICRAVADAIARYSAALAAQAKRGWPDPIVLPEPKDAAEQVALELWTEQLRDETGASVTIRHR